MTTLSCTKPLVLAITTLLIAPLSFTRSRPLSIRNAEVYVEVEGEDGQLSRRQRGFEAVFGSAALACSRLGRHALGILVLLTSHPY